MSMRSVLRYSATLRDREYVRCVTWSYPSLHHSQYSCVCHLPVPLSLTGVINHWRYLKDQMAATKRKKMVAAYKQSLKVMIAKMLTTQLGDFMTPLDLPHMMEDPEALLDLMHVQQYCVSKALSP